LLIIIYAKVSKIVLFFEFDVSLYSNLLGVSCLIFFIAVVMAEFFSSVILQSANSPLIIASTGASAMLMFGSPHALVQMDFYL
jgi:CBS domain-containing membrane protein